MTRNQVVLVDPNDKAIGVMDKIEAHILGELHRAFSIFIFNNQGQILLQQRASHKYHGGNLWTNACCSHPQWNEDLKASAVERLDFEMGMSCDIEYVFSFIYHSPVENNLIEHELDHVFVGITDEQPQLNLEEVQNYKWMNLDELLEHIEAQPEKYTYWFRVSIHRVLAEMHSGIFSTVG